MFNEKTFIFNKKYMISKKIPLYSIKYVCIQSKIFVFDIFTLCFYFYINCVMGYDDEICIS